MKVNAQLAARLFETPAHAAFPVCTQVTLNHGICDSHCLSCPIGRVNHGDATDTVEAELTRSERTSMAFETFQKVADEVAQYPHAWLRMHARGEPLLHPRFVDMLAYAKSVGVRLVQAFSDGISLTETKARGILDAKLDVFEFSVHGHTKTYPLLMRTKQHDRVIANIKRFRDLRKCGGHQTKIVVSAVDQPGLQPEKEAHRAFWSEIADEVIYRPHHSWGNRVDGICAAVPEQRHPCSQLWNRCTIGPTGNILACFNSWSENPEEVLGNILHPGVTIARAWVSAHYQGVRSDHAQGNYTLPCCAGCKDWTGSSWGENSYEHLLSEKLQVGSR